MKTNLELIERIRREFRDTDGLIVSDAQLDEWITAVCVLAWGARSQEGLRENVVSEAIVLGVLSRAHLADGNPAVAYEYERRLERLLKEMKR